MGIISAGWEGDAATSERQRNTAYVTTLSILVEEKQGNLLQLSVCFRFFLHHLAQNMAKAIGVSS